MSWLSSQSTACTIRTTTWSSHITAHSNYVWYVTLNRRRHSCSPDEHSKISGGEWRQGVSVSIKLNFDWHLLRMCQVNVVKISNFLVGSFTILCTSSLSLSILFHAVAPLIFSPCPPHSPSRLSSVREFTTRSETERRRKKLELEKCYLKISFSREPSVRATRANIRRLKSN